VRSRSRESTSIYGNRTLSNSRFVVSGVLVMEFIVELKHEIVENVSFDYCCVRRCRRCNEGAFIRTRGLIENNTVHYITFRVYQINGLIIDSLNLTGFN